MRTHQGLVHLRPGICLWMRPGGLYLAEQDLHDRLGVSFRHFSLLDARGALRPYAAPVPPILNDVADVNFVDGVLSRVNELLRSSGEQAEAIAAQLFTGLLMDLDARASRRGGAGEADESATDRRHRQTVLALAQRIDESPLEAQSVAELARKAGYSPDHFARIFRKVLGQAPREYALRARIDRARQLLAETDLSVSEIAFALGYKDVYFFSRQFRQKTGTTASAYRRGAAAQPLL
ncbi:MAG: helix-turn-helix transcriptional regulator [Planctomycetota bacterium]|nr:helix-turn-helix transcriptional regulator [Planctomycetota bacterium]